MTFNTDPDARSARRELARQLAAASAPARTAAAAAHAAAIAERDARIAATFADMKARAARMHDATGLVTEMKFHQEGGRTARPMPSHHRG